MTNSAPANKNDDDMLSMHSPNLVDDNVQKISELFPNCITEAKDENGKLKKAVDFDLLRQELSQSLVEGGQERYRLDWPGKRQAILEANAPIAKTLRPARHESVNFDTTENLFIEGDNLEALKLLQESYLGEVKMIYIDPPYNTGNDFIYKDDFSEDTADFLERSERLDKEGNRLIDNYELNSETNGRFHSDWLTMMYSRIRLTKSLLKEDGVIFVSCDENEHAKLKLILDETFGQNNFIADLVWAGGRKNDSQHISVSHEYIICYVKSLSYLKNKKIIWRQKKKGLDNIYKKANKLKKEFRNDYQRIHEELKHWYKNLADGDPSKDHKHYSHMDENGIYFASDISWPGGGGPKYEVLHPTTQQPVKIPSRGWVTSSQAKMKEWIDNGLVHFGIDENYVPCLKTYLKDKEVQTPYSVFYQDGRAASKRLTQLMGNNVFPYPKDEEVISELVSMVTNEDDIIIDFFAGSSTTAHAVMDLNAQDSGNRKFIMIQLPEITDEKSEAHKAGYSTIAELSKERIRRAGQKILADNQDKDGINDLDIGFRVLKIDETNMKKVYYTPDEYSQAELDNLESHIKEDRTGEDLLFQVMLDWGVPLSLPIESKQIQGSTVYYVGINSLVACFDTLTTDLVDEVSKDEPLKFVSSELAIAHDQDKTNIKARFAQLSPDTQVKFI
ncbi:site-specific DNA-methyltransferase [Psychrobacter cibarius]|uniref:site-specific DNA-methyltransferase n=1 Tax=Psychrobacter TaxID=497 RepID=UPI001D101BDC|nr:site-specific DNA-methyltransferase [Psychrobacter sp. Pi2-51]